MKIALIGNMNNNFFSIMRYFRDLDMDAHLFMYKDEYEHFMPEKDTYYIEKYKDYIHMLPIGTNVKSLLLLKKDKIKKELEDYDFFIGCGMAPAIFLKLDIVLDIFIPYDDALESTVKSKFKFKNFLKILVRRYLVYYQIKGLKENTTKVIASAIQEITKDTINRLNLSEQLIRKYVPMVYVEENIENQKLNKIVNAMSNNDLVIFSHTRHFWKEKHFTEEHIKKDGLKGLDKLIIGYSEFIKNNPTAKPLLVFFEYGSDVDASKELIAKLNIDKYVMWLSLMARKDILQLINHSDIVVDALGATMWGGVGWEALASGKIFMQNIVQTDKEYYDEMGHNIPFLMRAKSAIDVEKHLTNFIKNREYYLKKSEDNREWFNKYAGIGLAKEYKEIVKELYFQK